MKIKTEHKEWLKASQSNAFIKDDDEHRELEVRDLAWEDGIYLAIYEDDRMDINIIVPRKKLEKFLKQARKNARAYQEALPAVSEQLAELPIGTRFTVGEDGAEFIKVGKDYYIETDEKLMVNARKLDLGFLNAADFDDDEGESRKITVVDD
jgi:hypothetical protein